MGFSCYDNNLEIYTYLYLHNINSYNSCKFNCAKTFFGKHGNLHILYLK